VFSTPALGAVTQSYNGPPPLDFGAMTPPPELAGHPKYRVVRPLGFGGMGTVWLAEHTVMGRVVALKVVRPEWLARPGAAERFQREVRAAAKLKHEHIATAYDAEQVGDRHFLVMEYVPGESLHDALRRGPLPAAEACRAVRDAARGLAHAHAAGLVHRDVKPGNLIRTPDGMTKVLDFGLVSVAEPEGSALTGENLVMGTPDYIAPEQADRAADARSDIYALGCTLYHLLAGRVPYPADSVLKKIDAHRDPARGPQAIPGASPGLFDVVARMMAKDPRDRFQTAGDVAAALEPFAAAVEPTPTPTRQPDGRGWLIAAGVLFAAVGLALAGVVYRIQTDKGEVVITPLDDTVEIVLLKGGKEVRVLDTKTNKSVTLPVGEYDVMVKNKPDDLTLKTDKVTVMRGKEVLVLIERSPAKPQGGTVAPAATVLPGGWKRLHRLPVPDGTAATWLHYPRWSPDSQRLLAQEFIPGKQIRQTVWDMKTGAVLHQLTHPTPSYIYPWLTNDPNTLFLQLDDRMTAWDLPSRSRTRQFGILPYLGQQCRTSDVSADGKFYCVYTTPQSGNVNEGWIEVRSVDDPKRSFKIPALNAHTVLLEEPRFTPDGKHLGTLDYSTTGNGTFRLWDVVTGKLVHETTIETRPMLRFEFTADARRISVHCSHKGAFAVGTFDAATGKLISAAPIVSRTGYGVSVPSSTLFVEFTEDLKGMTAIDCVTGKRSAEYRPGGITKTMSASPDGKKLAIVTETFVEVLELPDPLVEPKRK
jgi:hypothetical protein